MTHPNDSKMENPRRYSLTPYDIPFRTPSVMNFERGHKIKLKCIPYIMLFCASIATGARRNGYGLIKIHSKRAFSLRFPEELVLNRCVSCVVGRRLGIGQMLRQQSAASRPLATIFELGIIKLLPIIELLAQRHTRWMEFVCQINRPVRELGVCTGTQLMDTVLVLGKYKIAKISIQI